MVAKNQITVRLILVTQHKSPQCQQQPPRQHLREAMENQKYTGNQTPITQHNTSPNQHI